MPLAAESTGVALAAALVGILAAAATVIAAINARRGVQEANETQDELKDFTVLRGTVETLSGEVERLTGEVHDARTEAQWLNRELAAARSNVRILSQHIRQHIPEVPFPRLVAMNDDG